MTRLRTLALPLALALAACGGEAEPAAGGTATSAEPPAEAAAEPVEARVEGGVQVAAVAVDGAAFDPAAVRLRAGVPARLVFTRNDEPTCATEVVATALGVDTTALPVGVPVPVEFTPAEAGTFTFACGMDMVTAQIVVQS